MRKLKLALLMELSIVIPTHNRPDLLQQVVAALLKQSIPAARYEIVIVDSNSSDGRTPEVLARFELENKNVRGLSVKRAGAAAARNAGLNAAKGELIALLDDDILVEKDFAERLLRGAGEHPGCVLLGKIEAPWTDSRDPFHRFLLESNDVNCYDFADRTNVSPQYFYTACVAIPRAVLKDTRFDEQFTVYGIEDLDFGIRLLSNGSKMVYVPELRVRHEYYPKYDEYRRKKRRTGYSLAYFIGKDARNAQYFYIEPNGTRLYYRCYALAAAPLAWLAEKFEANRTGPLSRVLYHWYYRDLRAQLYAGMRCFKSGGQP